MPQLAIALHISEASRYKDVHRHGYTEEQEEQETLHAQ